MWLAGGVAAATIGFVLGMVVSDGEGFYTLQLFSWLIFAHGVIVLGGSAVALWRSNRAAPGLSAGLALAVAVVGVDAFAVEPYRLEVTTYEVSSPKVPLPTRIVVIADFQTDTIGQYERHAMRLALDQQPDLILMPGDYLQQRELILSWCGIFGSCCGMSSSTRLWASLRCAATSTTPTGPICLRICR